MKRRIIACALAVGITGLLPAAQAQGAPAPKPSASARADKAKPDKSPANAVRLATEVMVLHATRSKKHGDKPQIDARIGPLPELEKEPFSLYNRYELLAKDRLPLVKNDPKSLTLPDGRILRTALLEVLPQRSVRFSAAINKPGGKDFLPLLEVKAKLGQAFMVAGQSYKGGILVLVVRVVE